MATYAATTEVSVEKSRAELERTLSRYGADEFLYGTKRGVVMVGFHMHDRQVRFLVPMPDPDSEQFTQTPTGRVATASAAEKAYEQACRQKWRALNLVVKAKLEAVDAGISTFESEFLANIVLPGGETVYERTQGWVDDAYRLGTVPPLMAIEP